MAPESIKVSLAHSVMLLRKVTVVKKYPENSAISTGGGNRLLFFTFALYAITCFAGLKEKYDAYIFLANLSSYSMVIAVTDADGC